eukprot:2193972-Pyramimonas_sp.AAC.1
MMDSIDSGKNKVPTWDGDQARFQYCEIWHGTWLVSNHRNKAVARARLAAALASEAWEALEEISEEC